MMTRLLIAAFTLAYLMCVVAERFWVAELATHWQLHLSAAALFFFLLYGYKRRIAPALIMITLSGLFALPVWVALAPPPPPHGRSIDRLSVLQFNIYFGNEKLAEEIIPWVIKQDADIIILQEVNAPRALELGVLKKHYPWWRVEVNDGRDSFGKAIFSRLPVKEYQQQPTGERWNYYSFLSVAMPSGATLHLYEVHLMPPVFPSFAAQRAKEMNFMARLLGSDKSAFRLLIGDLNSTPYSPLFRGLIAQSGLHHAQQGYRLKGTWPGFLPSPLRIGIDHLLASPQIAIESRETGPTFGSDHAAVLTQLALHN